MSRESTKIQLGLYLSASKEASELRRQRSEMWGLWNRFVAFWFFTVLLIGIEAFAEFRHGSVVGGVLGFMSYWGKCVLAALLGYVFARHEEQRFSRKGG